MEIFFYISCGDDEPSRIIDRFAHRYGWTLEQINDLDVVSFHEMNKQIRIEERRTEAREQWIAMFPMMVTGQINYMSFKDYYDQVSGVTLDLRPVDEIMAEIDEIEKELRGG